MTEKVPLTPVGRERLEGELRHLREVERPKVKQDIGTAREHGDLKENAEYHAARERQSFIEGRIQEIESILSRAEVIDPKKLTGSKIRFGATVKLLNSRTDEEMTLQIVGVPEADIEKKTIAVTAPLARALIGKETGDEVIVITPSGEKREYEVLEVVYR